jgi:acetolactate synthase-1/2/3 large subunit
MTDTATTAPAADGDLDRPAPASDHFPRTVQVGKAIVNALAAEGVSMIFGMPGGHILPIYDAVLDEPSIRSILVRHEHQAAAMAAAHAQLTGRPGVVLVTAGPGVTNTLTAVAEAWVGALPMIVLGGRASTVTAHRGASQEIPTDQVFAPVTKWSVRVDRADLVLDTLRRAFTVARGGRPGPVLIDLPRDILLEHVRDDGYVPSAPPPRPEADPSAVALAARKLAAAACPLLVAGGGAIASEASDAVLQLAEALDAPVITSLAGRGIIPEDHPLAVGGLGAHRNAVSKRLLAEADVVLGLGTRFEEMETNWRPGAVPGPNASYLQVDIDPSQIGRSVRADLALIGDVRTVTQQLIDDLPVREARPAEHDGRAGERLQRLARDLAELEDSVDEMARSAARPIHPVRAIRSAGRVFGEDAVLGFDVGALAQHIGGAFPITRVHGQRSAVVPSSFYGMGFVAAAMPVAKLVHPDRPALCFVGDGSFQMVMPILPTAAHYRLGVTWVVLNDDALGSIWDQQHYSYDDRIIDTVFDLQPDLAGVAVACGCAGERVETPDDLDSAFGRALAANREGIPAVVDVAVARERLPQTREHAPNVYLQ